MNKIKKEKGVTLIALIVTIIVLIILATITIVEGKSLIKKAKQESIMTNMITIKSKAKVLAEEANGELWDLTGDEKANKRDAIFTFEKYKMNNTTLNEEQKNQLSSEEFEDQNEIVCYALSDETLNIIGFTEVENCEDFILVFSRDNFDKLDIVFNPGVKYQNETIYSLSYMQLKMEE